jgi:hypothetical protein
MHTMKESLLTGLAAFGLAIGAYGQGMILVDNTTGYYGLCEGSAGNYYFGPFGLEVWFKNGTSYNVNTVNQYIGTNPLAAYSQLISSGFSKVGTYVGAQSDAPGFVQLGTLLIPGVSPAGSDITVALAAWKGAGASFIGAAKTAVLAFRNPTTDYTQEPTPLPWSVSYGWDAVGVDLVMSVMTVPEPSTLALVGMSGVALVTLRRQK